MSNIEEKIESSFPNPLIPTNDSIDIVVNVEKDNEIKQRLENLQVHPDILDKYLSFVDCENTKMIVSRLTFDSNAVKSIIHIVELILEDNKIDINDIPLIYNLFRKLIYIKSIDFDKVKNINNIIKIILVVLTKENILHVPNSDNFIKNIYKLIDELQMLENIPIKGCC
jgi:hypothetical protein